MLYSPLNNTKDLLQKSDCHNFESGCSLTSATQNHIFYAVVRSLAHYCKRSKIVFRWKSCFVIDSGFWYKHPKRFIMSVTNYEYWGEKIAGNAAKDKM